MGPRILPPEDTGRRILVGEGTIDRPFAMRLMQKRFVRFLYENIMSASSKEYIRGSSLVLPCSRQSQCLK